MIRVSKGELRTFKQRLVRLERAVPTLDLRRRQLNVEIKTWEARLLEQEKMVEDLKQKISKNPHLEISYLVSIEEASTELINIAGVILSILQEVRFKDFKWSKFATFPSFDHFVKLQKDLLTEQRRLEFYRKAIDRLEDELSITTQRINLFEKRMIPQSVEGIRYIKGRLEDNERANVMVAKIAQKKILQQQGMPETA